MAIDLIVWDLDGTLADTVGDITDSLNRAVAPFDAGPYTEDEVRPFIGGGIRNLISTAMQAEPEDIRVDVAVLNFRDDYAQNLLIRTCLYPGAREVLHHFRSKKQAVISNKLQTMTREIVQGLGIADHFLDVIGQGGDYPIKPDPTSTLAVINSAGATPERTLFVGDSETDYETARNAGCKIALVTYGLRPAAEMRSLRADAHVDALSELIDLIA